MKNQLNTSSAMRISISVLYMVWLGISNPQIGFCQTNAVDQTQSLTLIKENIHDATLDIDGNSYRIKTTGNDPFIYTNDLKSSLSPANSVLSFEYFCPRGLDHLEIYFCPPVDVKHSKLISKIGLSEGWVEFSVDLGNDIGDWGKVGENLRLDFGSISGVDIQLRNLRLRAKTAHEIQLASEYKEKKRKETILENNLNTYLTAEYPARITWVEVGNDKITISGNAEKASSLSLCEVPPYQDVTEEQTFATTIPVSGKTFKISAPRFIKREGQTYDRLLSKWVLAKKTASGYLLVSHARYPDQIKAKYNLADEKATSRKGLGGFSTNRGHTEDLKDLDITSATVNIWITRFMYSKTAPDRIEHQYNGKFFYFDKKKVAEFDSTFSLTARKNIVTAAILLIDKIENCADPEIGKLLQHPDCDPAGIYAMPNMTNPASVECYAAALDFLASRYSRPDKKYGRCNHWIMHNEVDAGWVWTNAGDKTALVFMDIYIKSMRMCYNIARSYNPHSEVFVTLTHYWAWTSHPKFYPSKDLMEYLLQYGRAEGDFQWAMAQHPYPEDLFEPKTWLDPKVTFDFNTPLITFKNLEVLNAWIKQPEALYQGKTKRTLWLSENGTNSKTYSDQDLKEQAAGFAYTWKKMKDLDGIDGFQWHNWFDNRGEGGLRIGLRRFPDDETDPGGAKPVWYVYQSAGRANEDSVFDQYKKVIGIKSWDEVNYIGEIDPAKKQQSYRDLKSDSWVATDALGRKLPTYEDCGPIKKDRFVGMFYFMTHITPGGPGPYDVTKTMKANPDNPQWVDGDYFWGEPENGYYLSYEKWMIRRHAQLLSDAGVDVIIFDVTNDKTFPEVYLPVCEVFREMRSKGEKTPDIAFLGSEISVNKLWNDFYKKAMYPDLWFQWKGKPLLLFGQHEIPSRKKNNDVVFAEEIRNFFSIRQSWAWTSLPWYQSCPYGKDKWPWVDHYPQAINWHESPDKAEMIPVAVGQHPLSNIGRSFHNYNQPLADKYDLTPFTDQGLCFEEQWSRALEVDPEFVFVTGWNEWSAGAQVMGKDINKSLLKWNFYPGANLGKGGRKLKEGDHYFIDQYNQEFSRDIEPMTGGHTDNYYYQLMANIRKYKGMEKPVEAGPPVAIDIRGDFKQWNKVEAIYHDHTGDTEHRNSRGQGKAGPYVNTTGRNDIVTLKVAYDASSVYFYAETNDNLSPSTDKNWMLLFVDTDQQKETGWEGYDMVINSIITDSKMTNLSWLNKDGSIEKSVAVPYQVKQNKLMIKVKRSDLSKNEKLAFDFHWADNIQKIGDITEFFLNGDNAPERRSNYRFQAGNTEYHVSINGKDTNEGSELNPFRTISNAAQKAQPGDVITVHAGTYRERVNPPRGGTSDSRRITYQAAPGEKVEIKGSEVVTNWVKIQSDLWQAIVPNSVFGSFNPFNDIIQGDWFNDKGRKHHTAAVYLNGEWLTEAGKLEDLMKSADMNPLWFSQVDKQNTTIWAQFKGKDPNKELIEINVRQTVFYPDQPWRNFITVRGFIMKDAATPWAPPTAEQIGLIGTNWSKGWIIENNTISHSICSGITLGKHGDEFDNTSANSAEGYVKTIERAQTFHIPWTRENIGHHIVRNNTISYCEQTGIVGSMGCSFSTVTGNNIHDIHVQQLFTGAEMAGIKFHGAIDTEISHNHIYRTNRGIWLDWMAQGTRVTGNLLHDNSQEDIYMEVNHGPFLVANNLLLSSRSLWDMSEGGAYVHNLMTGKIDNWYDMGRLTPYMQPHSTTIAGLSVTQGGEDRFFNNIFIGKGLPGDAPIRSSDPRTSVVGFGLCVYDTRDFVLQTGGNVYFNGARPHTMEVNPLTQKEVDPKVKLVEKSDGWFLEIDCDKAWFTGSYRKLITTEILGLAAIPQLPYENVDGSPLVVNFDYFGKKRDLQYPSTGPFENPGQGRVKIKVWPR